MKLWVVRDLSEELILYKEQPFYNNKIKMWMHGGLPVGRLAGNSFPEVTFENSPVEVELDLKLTTTEPQEDWHEHCEKIGKLCREVLGKE